MFPSHRQTLTVTPTLREKEKSNRKETKWFQRGATVVEEGGSGGAAADSSRGFAAPTPQKEEGVTEQRLRFMITERRDEKRSRLGINQLVGGWGGLKEVTKTGVFKGKC